MVTFFVHCVGTYRGTRSYAFSGAVACLCEHICPCLFRARALSSRRTRLECQLLASFLWSHIAVRINCDSLSPPVLKLLLLLSRRGFELSFVGMVVLLYLRVYRVMVRYLKTNNFIYYCS